VLGLPLAPPGQPPTSLAVFWQMLGRVVAQYAQSSAHVDITITMKNGKVELLRFTQTCLPTQLPRG
jgi:hypothetical protein